jgi:hypothetical protein
MFFSGSLAQRFCALTGPETGPVPGSTGSTGRSGFDNLGNMHTTILLLF